VKILNWRHKVKRRYAVLFGTALVFVFGSCKSAPKTEEPVAAEVEKPAEPAPAPVEPAPVAKIIDNSDALSKAAAARQAAIDAGADKAAADMFAAADNLYNALKTRSETGEDATGGLKDVTARYQALAEYTKALEIKARIDQLGYSSYDQGDYDKGCAAAGTFESFASAEGVTGSQMYDKAHLAYTSFSNALVTAFRKLAQDERTAAFKSKRDADSVYAGVSQKDAYTAAVASFRSGDTSFSMQDPENALKHYQDAHHAFDVLYADISEKRAAAQKAIDDAKNKVAESAEYADQADKNAPLEGDNIKGIESHDAVLLQAESYEDPKKSEEDIPETITESAGENSENNVKEAAE
jgi:hypothetical protein